VLVFCADSHQHGQVVLSDEATLLVGFFEQQPPRVGWITRVEKVLGQAQVDAGLIETPGPRAAFHHEDRDIRPPPRRLLGDPGKHKRPLERLRVDKREVLRLPLSPKRSAGTSASTSWQPRTAFWPGADGRVGRGRPRWAGANRLFRQASVLGFTGTLPGGRRPTIQPVCLSHPAGIGMGFVAV